MKRIIVTTEARWEALRKLVKDHMEMRDSEEQMAYWEGILYDIDYAREG